MRTVIVGGGRGCRAIIRLARGSFLKELPLDILCVADPDSKAPGMVFARLKGIRTTSDMREALSVPNLHLVIELTGKDDVLESIYQHIPRNVKVFDHTFAKVFVDLANAQQDQARQIFEITDLESRIEKEKMFLQSLFDKMPELVAVVDNGRRINKVNAGLSRFSGFSVNNAVGKSLDQLLVSTELLDSVPQVNATIDRVSESGETEPLVWQSAPPHETVWEINVTPMVGEDDRDQEFLLTWHPITEKAILQNQVASAETRFRAFIDSAHDWISVKDLQGRYQIVNKIVAKSLHMRTEDFIGKTALEALPPDLAEMVTTHDEQVVAEDSYRTFNEIVPIDGRNTHFLTNRFPLKDYKGSTIGVCTIMRNVTSEITLRKQLEQAEKLAAIGKLAAGVAHEINNPLTGVLAYAEDLLDSTPENCAQHEDLKVIIRETMRCREIVRNLLDFSRQENPKFERLAPNDVVEKSLLLVTKLPQFRDVQIDTVLDEEVPPIHGDPHQIQQVLLNFMLNAAEAMEGKGRVLLTTRFDRRRNRCVIVVEDNGPGIPEDLKDQIFEPFFSTKGTNGLGLAVSWGIIERHMGNIRIGESESGGAAFSIIFPSYEDGVDFFEERNGKGAPD